MVSLVIDSAGRRRRKWALDMAGLGAGLSGTEKDLAKELAHEAFEARFKTGLQQQGTAREVVRRTGQSDELFGFTVAVLRALFRGEPL